MSDENLEDEHWVLNSKIFFDWCIEQIGEDQWIERRQRIVKHFKSLERPAASDSEQVPLALYRDWMGWYLYLVENIGLRPECDEPHQSARILPIFASLGRHIELLKGIKGVTKRLEELLDEKKNQADSTLFELLIGACYARNGWEVEFLEEAMTSKTPDILVRKGEEEIFVECKRLAKVGAYAEKERQEWLIRWRELLNCIGQTSPPIHIEVTFEREVSGTLQDILVRLFKKIRKKSKNCEGQAHLGGVTLVSRGIDMVALRNHFSENCVRHASPQMIALLAGEYVPFRNYTHAVVPTGLVQVGDDDGTYCLNTFCEGVSHAISAEWSCVAQESIQRKARHVKKTLSKAVSQFPDGKVGVVHIGFETVDLRLVEYVRQKENFEDVSSFDCGAKEVSAVFLHSFQCGPAEVERFECAETTQCFNGQTGQAPSEILNHDMLLDSDDTVSDEDTHWNQDFKAGL